MPSKTYFSIEGNIGSGKSTLLACLKKTKLGETIPEPVECYSSFFGCGGTTHFNPLKEMYADPPRSAALGQLHILRVCSNYFKFRQQQSTSSVLISERSLLSPLGFIDAQHYHGNISTFSAEFLKKELAVLQCEGAGYLPRYVIFLKAPPELCFERMKSRGHDEEKLVSLSYLKSVDQALCNQFSGSCDVFTIEIEQSTCKEKVLRQAIDIISKHE